MTLKHAIVITSINGRHPVLRDIERLAATNNWDMIVAGDTTSKGFCETRYFRYLSVAEQVGSSFHLGRLAPVRNYCRKNFAYLEAIKRGAEVIVETDDDNLPTKNFFRSRVLTCDRHIADVKGWVNVFRYFTDNKMIWPRGYDLSKIKVPPPSFVDLELKLTTCPVQCGMINGDPDVDAVYRLLFSVPFEFSYEDREVCLGKDAVCTFNSQNTAFFKSAFPLMYLPATPYFRETDIVRSLVIQRILSSTNERVLFHGANITQLRNSHDLMDDLRQETRLYAHIGRLCSKLKNVRFGKGASIRVKLHKCYEVFHECGIINPIEHDMIEAWCDDLSEIGSLDGL